MIDPKWWAKIRDDIELILLAEPEADRAKLDNLIAQLNAIADDELHDIGWARWRKLTDELWEEIEAIRRYTDTDPFAEPTKETETE